MNATETEETEPEKFVPPPPPVRSGKTVDQDGKSNNWALEPTMKVAEEGEGANLLVVGGATAALLAGMVAITANINVVD